jgi:hypothetical protein
MLIAGFDQAQALRPAATGINPLGPKMLDDKLPAKKGRPARCYWESCGLSCPAQQKNAGASRPSWVKLRRTQSEQMSSGLPLQADIAQYSRHVSKVPTGDTPAIGLCLPPSMLTVVSPLATITQAPAGTKQAAATLRPFVVRTSGAPLAITNDSDTRDST